MLERKTQKEVFERDDIHIFQYTLNPTGVRMMEFGSLFLFTIAVLIYPMTHFEPRFWMIPPIILAALGIYLLIVAQYWRAFAKSGFIAYDKDYLFISDDKNKARMIPWNILDLQNTGLAAPGKGADLKFNIDGEKFPVRLFSPVVCIPQFKEVLSAILPHIKDNTKSS